MQFTMIHGPYIPGCYAVLFFTGSGFTFTTRYIHNWVSFPFWPILLHSEAISLLFISSILDLLTWGSSSSVITFCLFMLFMGFLKQEYWSGFPFPSPGNKILQYFLNQIRILKQKILFSHSKTIIWGIFYDVCTFSSSFWGIIDII